MKTAVKICVCVCNRGRGSLFETRMYADCLKRERKRIRPRFKSNSPSQKGRILQTGRKMCHPSLPLSSSIVHFQIPPCFHIGQGGILYLLNSGKSICVCKKSTCFECLMTHCGFVELRLWKGHSCIKKKYLILGIKN